MSVVKKADPSIPDDLSNVEFETSEDIEVLPSFDSINLNEHLLRGIYAYGMFLYSFQIQFVFNLNW